MELSFTQKKSIRKNFGKLKETLWDLKNIYGKSERHSFDSVRILKGSLAFNKNSERTLKESKWGIMMIWMFCNSVSPAQEI